ncbi:MAG: hypothetical protein ACTS8R_09470 [Arsenophonus sp. NC-QC1-MAG3]
MILHLTAVAIEEKYLILSLSFKIVITNCLAQGVIYGPFFPSHAHGNMATKGYG